MAPDAALYFANFDSVVSHSDAVDWLIAQQVDVINYSYGWVNVGPGDGRGVINDHVRRALDAGIEWVVSAGNQAEVHWAAPFSDNDSDGWHNYAPGDEGNSVWLEAGEGLTVFLNWDDWFGSDQDYDLYIFDPWDRLIAWSEGSQTGWQYPREAAGFVAPWSGWYWVGIHKYRASRPARLRAFFWFTLGPDREMQYIVPEGSLMIPADTDGAIAVGATYWSDDVIESYSSQGPTTDGRMKPELSAPDGVDTASYLGQGSGFYGTSAAAPHVTGAIALLKSRFGAFSLDQIVEILYGRTEDLGPTGKDNQYGEGRLDVVG
jgi:subtilisin family serine protease